MAKVLVMNPPKHKKAKRHKRRASPAQLRALAKGRAKQAAKRGLKKHARKARRARHARKSLLQKDGRHRPVVIVKKRRMRRPKRSTIPARSAFANPFLGELAMLGNPKRKKHMAKRRHRRHTKRHNRGLRLNPSGALAAVAAGPREMVSGEFVKEAASVAAGFILPGLLMPRLPLALRDQTWKAYASKVVVVAGVSAAAGMAISKRAAKLVLLGGGVSLLLDLYADFVAPTLGRMSAPTPSTGTGAYYGNDGDPGVSSFYGNAGDPGTAPSLADAFAS